MKSNRVRLRSALSPLLSLTFFLFIFAVSVRVEPASSKPTSQPSDLTQSPVPAVPLPTGTTRIFDGSTLTGWIPDPRYYPSISASSITDVGAFVRRLQEKADPVSTSLNSQLDDAARDALTSLAADPADTAQLKPLLKSLNKTINGPSIAASSKSTDNQAPEDQIAWQNRQTIQAAFPEIKTASDTPPWIVKDGALASTGMGRGVLYTQQDYSRYRIVFDIRHVSGKPDHQACVLVFCSRPPAGKKGMDALGGIQFQVPNGGHWDYRKGKNNGGGSEFTTIKKGTFNIHEWSRVEIVADSTTGTARMAIGQPPGSHATEILDFHDPAAGQTGPFALQIHNAGLFDEYANIAIEENPATMDLITTTDK
jgi:hypothetical protein